MYIPIMKPLSEILSPVMRSYLFHFCCVLDVQQLAPFDKLPVAEPESSETGAGGGEET